MHSYIYLVTEKSNLLANNGTHVFLTNKSVNKIEAQKDLEKIYGEKIKSIRAISVPMKTRQAGKKTITRRNASKKLYVTFKSKDVKINS
ncbi:50S ribosomal protein L23 [bacterium]|jgi:ribosomal protein L23|nr:50S ribosomal protein L23 [bacterium]MBT6293606.1 50S ribosomal protein L23 [bacterium]